MKLQQDEFELLMEAKDKELSEVTINLNKLEKKVKVLGNQLDMESTMKEELKEQLASTKSDVTSRDHVIKKLQSELSNNQRETENSNLDLERKTQKIERKLKSVNNQLELEMSSKEELKHQLSSTHSQIASLQDIVHNQQAEIASLMYQHNSVIQEHSKTIEFLDKKNKGLVSELESETTSKEQIKLQLSIADTQLQASLQSSNELVMKVHSLEEQLSKAKSPRSAPVKSNMNDEKSTANPVYDKILTDTIVMETSYVWKLMVIKSFSLLENSSSLLSEPNLSLGTYFLCEASILLS